jgi:hypothetical protein
MRLPAPPPSLLDFRISAAPPSPEFVEARRRLWFDDAGGRPLERPAQLLTEYYADRRGSPVRRIVETANRWAIDLETVVLVAPRRSAEVARGIFEATAHPYYNSLSHGARGGRPRLAILEPVDDDDLLEGVLDLVRRTGESVDRHDRWGVWIEGADEPAEADALWATATPLLTALGECTRSVDDARFRTVVTNATGEPGPLPGDAPATFARRLDFPTLWDGGGFAAAALCGADVVGLAKGMTWFVELLKRRSPDECPVTSLVTRIADGPGSPSSVSRGPVELRTQHHALDGLADWLARGINGTVGKTRSDCSSLVTVASGWQTAESCRSEAAGDARRLHLLCDAARRDRLRTAATAVSADSSTGHHVGERASRDSREEVRIKRLNEVAIGELCAWLSAAKLLWEAVC